MFNINIGTVPNLSIVPFFSHRFVAGVDCHVPFYVMLCQVELRAFCLKHSDLQENRSILPLGGPIVPGSESSEANDLPVTLPMSSERCVKIDCGNGEVVSDGNPDTLNHNDEPPDGGLSDCRFSTHNMLGCGDVPQHNIGVAGRTNENVDASDSLSFALVLKKVFCIISICMCVCV